MFANMLSRSARPSAADLVARHARGEVLLVDVRESAEVQASGIASGAVHVPLGRLAQVADPRNPAHDPAFAPARPVALYCASGGRSQVGCGILAQLGYRDVTNAGGLGDWAAAGGKVVRV
ncbi:MAG: rhodanese-like domain-containing protein [Gemmobacter sp.]|jgi:rhodanese-related sulfurtransferase